MTESRLKDYRINSIKAYRLLAVEPPLREVAAGRWVTVFIELLFTYLKAYRLLAVEFSSFVATRRYFKEEVVERSETRWWLLNLTV